MESTSGFVLALLAILLVPGPTNTLLAASGATVGMVRSLPLLLSELLGYESAITLFRLLLVPLLARLPSGTRLMHGFAAAYLVALAVGLWRWRLAQSTRAVQPHHVLITTLLNPKALIIALVLMPFSGAAASSATVVHEWVVMTVLIPVIGGTWVGFGRLLSRSPSRTLTALIPKAASVVLGLFAVVLIVSALR
jgi:threonine/homoserine/homoserine lactone efflux protein